VTTFGSLHKLNKLNGAVLELWARLLQAVPGARLLVCRNTMQGPTAAWLQEQFAQRGVDPQRVVCGPVQTGNMRHLQAYQEIDVALDSFPWSGHTTACEALWMGVPVVTLRGERYAGRMTASVLESLGLGEWVAATPEDYVRIAAELAAAEQERARLRQELRPLLLRSSLCDGRSFTRGLEEVYRRLWQRWCARPGNQTAAPASGP
jgi:predicted O-linked N-acetylglucosamine transferase (SPINDLY family)